MAQSNLDIVP